MYRYSLLQYCLYTHASLCISTEMLFTLFEPLITADSIQYANGQEWEDRRKWLYESLKGTFLEGYVPIFVKVS